MADSNEFQSGYKKAIVVIIIIQYCLSSCYQVVSFKYSVLATEKDLDPIFK